jgi:hypothetical protein
MNQTDLTTLRVITDALAERAGDPERRDGWVRWTASTAAHRWLVPSWERLAATSRADGVGFFGRPRAGEIDDFPSELEPRVADGAAAQGWLLAYLNVRFLDAPAAHGPRYANLVVVTDRAAVQTLVDDPAHIEAVTRAARAYESIRIHRLALTGPLTSRPAIQILETLSIDYASTPPTRTVRAVESERGMSGRSPSPGTRSSSAK